MLNPTQTAERLLNTVLKCCQALTLLYVSFLQEKKKDSYLQTKETRGSDGGLVSCFASVCQSCAAGSPRGSSAFPGGPCGAGCAQTQRAAEVNTFRFQATEGL